MSLLFEDRFTVNDLAEIQRYLRDHGCWQFKTFATSAQYWIAYRKTLEHVKTGSNVLDWGCGNLHFSYFLLQTGYRTSAYTLDPDQNTRLLACLQDEFQDNFSPVTGDPSDPVSLPFADRTFEAVCSIGVLEHVRETGGNELATMAQIHRILKPGGLFLCFHLPNKYSWIEAISRHIPSKHHHAYRYSYRDIIDINTRSGFILKEVGRYALLPRNLLARLPAAMADSRAFVKVYNWTDRLLGRAFFPVVQNFYFVSCRVDG